MSIISRIRFAGIDAFHILLALPLFLPIMGLPIMVSAQADNTKILPVTYHDFNGTHADFENPTCRGGVGMVQDTLGPDRKPVHLPGNLCADNALHDWFHDSPDNTRYCRNLTLTKKAGTLNTYEYSNAHFFPIDSVATNEKKYKGGDGLIHNFHFCMELHASFRYQGGEVFDFLGDDDFWVYINNHLALDLGGLHEALPGTVDLDAQKDQLKLSLGNYYNFDFFFCERQTSESDIKVTTNIDILPPPASGLHIADGKLNILGAGDTLTLPKGGGSATFNSIKTSTEAQTVDCADVLTQVKNPISGNWTLGATALTPGPSATVNPDALATGVYKLVFEKDGLKDSLWVNIPILPTAAMPVANPPGGPFAGMLKVALASSTPGAAIHYTVDGSTPTAASPVYAGPIPLSASGTVKAIAVKAGFNTSAVMAENYARLLAKALKGYYQDRDGDGRIETAVILFDSNFTAAPKGILFTDPFDKAAAVKPLGVVPGVRSLTVTLPPFAPGTGFPAEELAGITAEADAFGAQGVIMEDSVGPVLKGVESFPSADSSVTPSAQVEFSEPVPLDAAAKSFPFEIKRANAAVDAAGIRVTAVERLSPTVYRFSFAPDSKYPVPGDSLRIAQAAAVSDVVGNRSGMRFYVPVTGNPARAGADLHVGLEQGVTSGPALLVRPNPNPVVVHGSAVCVNCGDPGVRELLPTGDPAVISSLGPTWMVKTKYPFRYSLFFYDNLGQFVNKAEGDVDPVRFEALRAGTKAGDSVAVELTFLPVSREGNTIATGAYIMKGILQIRDQAGLKGAQGEDVKLAPTERNIVSRFGYMRKAR